MNTEIISGLKSSGSKERILQNALHSGLKDPSSNGMKSFATLAARLYKAQRGLETILNFGRDQWVVVEPFLDWNEELQMYMFGTYPCVCNEYN
jgi:hypothetical protein